MCACAVRWISEGVLLCACHHTRHTHRTAASCSRTHVGPRSYISPGSIRSVNTHTHTHTADADTAGPLFFGHPSLLWCVLCLTLPSLSCSFSSLCAAYWNLTSTTLSMPFALLRSPSVAVFFVSFSAPFTRVTLWLPLDCCSKTNMFLMLFLQFLPIKPEKNMLAGTNAGM